MVKIMANQASKCDLKELVSKFIPEVIGHEIEKETAGIFPLQNVFIRKVKILKDPKFDLGRLMEVIPNAKIIFCILQFSLTFILTSQVHADYYKEDVGVKVERPAGAMVGQDFTAVSCNKYWWSFHVAFLTAVGCNKLSCSFPGWFSYVVAGHFPLTICYVVDEHLCVWEAASLEVKFLF